MTAIVDQKCKHADRMPAVACHELLSTPPPLKHEGPTNLQLHCSNHLQEIRLLLAETLLTKMLLLRHENLPIIRG